MSLSVIFNLQDFCPGWREHRRTHPTVPVQNSPSANDIIRIMFLHKSKMTLMRMTLMWEGHGWILGGVWILGNPSANVALSPPIPLTRSHPDSLLKHFIHIYILPGKCKWVLFLLLNSSDYFLVISAQRLSGTLACISPWKLGGNKLDQTGG